MYFYTFEENIFLKLTIDIGNTGVKLAVFDGKHIIETHEAKECTFCTVQDFIGHKEISAAIISSVKDINSEIFSILDYYNGILLSERIPVPIRSHYKTPNTFGSDRLVAAVGAFFLYPKRDVIVFDAGTCLTVDFLSDKGEYLGGKISPGIEMRYRALHNFTDKLPLIQKEKKIPIFGNDTNSAITAGVQQGIIAEVKLTITEYRLQKPHVISLFTGGDCFFFEKELKSGIFANPNLVMVGLNEILDFNE